MSTPKIKVYRLEKGYNRDADNDIQSKVNNELLPFREKFSKPVDAYYLTGLSEQRVQWGGEKINPVTKYYLEKHAEATDTTGKSVGKDGYSMNEKGVYFPKKELFPNEKSNLSTPISISNLVKNGYFKPRLGVVQSEIADGNIGEMVFTEWERSDRNEVAIYEAIEKKDNSKPYYDDNSLVYAHPFMYSKAIQGASLSEDRPVYVEKYDGENLIIEVDEESLTTNLEYEFNRESTKFCTIRYYESNSSSKSVMMNDYPIYNHSNYYYNPMLFNAIKSPSPLTFDNGISAEIKCDDTWIYDGLGKPLVTMGDKILNEMQGAEGDYELQYSFENGVRKLRVKLNSGLSIDGDVYLHYNTDSTLISSGAYTIDADRGLITFNNEVPANLFIYYRKKLQHTDFYVSEFVNWSFGHLRENPDIFYGEKDYPGDESEDEEGNPLLGGLKPSFVSSGYQIDYARGAVDFQGVEKPTYRSTAESRDDRTIQTPETFVRANFSYYPEIHSVFRQKMELVDSVDGYVYKPTLDKRFGKSIGKRWIMKADDYQPMFFQSFTNQINTVSKYQKTAPNYDILDKKSIVEIFNTEAIEDNNRKLHFTLPVVDSTFIVFKIYEDVYNDKSPVWTEGLSHKISFYVENNLIEEFSLIEDNGVFNLNSTPLSEFSTSGKVDVIKGQKLTLMFSYLNQYSQVGVKTISFQLISVNANKEEATNE